MRNFFLTVFLIGGLSALPAFGQVDPIVEALATAGEVEVPAYSLETLEDELARRGFLRNGPLYARHRGDDWVLVVKNAEGTGWRAQLLECDALRCSVSPAPLRVVVGVSEAESRQAFSRLLADADAFSRLQDALNR